jgi:nucleotide-binding universal stress UspA family protein
MAGQKLLLPFNFTDYDRKALDFVIRTFVHLKDLEITLFNAYTQVPDIEGTDSTVMAKLKKDLLYLTKIISEQETALQEAKQTLIQHGFSEKSVSYIFKVRKKDIAAEIIDLVSSEGYDLIVLNHKPGKVSRFFSGSVYNKIVSTLKGITVCIVS